MKQRIKRISAVLAMAMALSAFSAFGVFAEGESTAPASAPQSTSTSQIANVEQQTESVSQGNGDGSWNIYIGCAANSGPIAAFIPAFQPAFRFF